LQSRIVRHCGAIDRSVEFAILQHLGHIFISGRALHARRVLVFGHMRVLERDPVHAADVDAVVVLENTAQPDARGLRIGAHPDAAADKIGWC
jgi:hypothetical protein